MFSLNGGIENDLRELNKALRKYKVSSRMREVLKTYTILVSILSAILWFILKWYDIKIFDFIYWCIYFVIILVPVIIYNSKVYNLKHNQQCVKDLHLKTFRQKVLPKVYKDWNYSYDTTDISMLSEIANSRFAIGSLAIDYLGSIYSKTLTVHEVVVMRPEYIVQGLVIMVSLQSFNNISNITEQVSKLNTKGYTYTDVRDEHILIFCTGISFDKFMGYENGVYTYEPISTKEFKSNYKIVRQILKIIDSILGG